MKSRDRTVYALERFVCIDVEMPNGESNRISAIGLSVFEGGVLKKQFYSLVNPETWFQPYVVRLIGITPDMVKDAPNFAALWPELEPLLTGSVLVAHGAGNDLKALGRCLRHYKIPWNNEVPYICTVEACTALYPQRQGYSLDVLCKDFDIPLEHHHALSDSEACGRLLLHCIADGLDSETCIKQFDLVRCRNKKKKRVRAPKSANAVEAAAAVIREDLIALAETRAAKTGELLTETHLGLRDADLFNYYRDNATDACLHTFIHDLPHKYDDENRLHAIVISNRSRFSFTIQCIDAFLPFVEDASTLALLRPKLFKRKQPELTDHLRRWLLSDERMEVLFGLQTLRLYYIKAPVLPMFLELVASLAGDDPLLSEEKTAFFAAALKRAPRRTLHFLQNHVRTEEESRAIAQVLEDELPERYADAIRALAQDCDAEQPQEHMCS